MVISGLYIQVKEEMMEEVAKQLAALPGVEVHGCFPPGKIIIVLESKNEDDAHEMVSQTIVNIPGVLGAYLAYCNFEELVS
ncbi:MULTISPECIES: chaperone NapD [Carboxydocella]|uniref:Periplasmic nitrate reductase chaperone NapD n=2 Tax=Carboxydocella TaxID=178898 RepID=A0A1T4R032_9FIRM|nr:MULTISPECIES: chaperone NapD [Carboxydocella]AVX19801.1 periplasmic nitrate reductase chaperone NapD [Carboxydocella thermautotrophica]AVX30210.1 periplasmic nitrate reductase chaperone NapD [Carboxydocella thermautotrophica]SKA09340.1 periplasmic nitrate reductase chaperone NapD [Carboxydocella sporoproducens DSM 16521]GAW28606.1 hypothetical protein ULO1_11760 [Carboxydocella sp. ULO1]GAW30695.1 hypothetical protein JDF658_04600 [Carboxydocella sp. JDF658]